jgi:hypothetical protein
MIVCSIERQNYAIHERLSTELPIEWEVGECEKREGKFSCVHYKHGMAMGRQPLP